MKTTLGIINFAINNHWDLDWIRRFGDKGQSNTIWSGNEFKNKIQWIYDLAMAMGLEQYKIFKPYEEYPEEVWISIMIGIVIYMNNNGISYIMECPSYKEPFQYYFNSLIEVWQEELPGIIKRIGEG